MFLQNRRSEEAELAHLKKKRKIHTMKHKKRKIISIIFIYAMRHVTCLGLRGFVFNDTIQFKN